MFNLVKKNAGGKPPPAKRKPVFGQADDDSDDDNRKGRSNVESIAEFDDFTSAISVTASAPSRKDKSRSKNAPPTAPPTLSKSKKGSTAMFGDLSSTRESQKHAEAAEALDPSIYDYDGVYDSLKPKAKTAAQEAADAERAPKYIDSLLAAAAVRKRDALIAEEKKIAKEREAEGDEYAGKEKFVTEAYKKQQEENRRLEEEEKKREEEEAKKNKTGGMSAFYRNMLDKGEQRHAEVMKAAEELAKRKADGLEPSENAQDDAQEASDADLARRVNEKGGAVAINDDGQVVDKRQLLKGGLNVVARNKPEPKRDNSQHGGAKPDREANRGRVFVGSGGGKQAMRDRQTRMMEEQLEQALKRSREAEEEEKEKIERATKSRKTEGEIEGAKERYLRRKREAEEAKKKAGSSD